MICDWIHNSVDVDGHMDAVKLCGTRRLNFKPTKRDLLCFLILLEDCPLLQLFSFPREFSSCSKEAVKATSHDREDPTTEALKGCALVLQIQRTPETLLHRIVSRLPDFGGGAIRQLRRHGSSLGRTRDVRSISRQRHTWVFPPFARAYV